MDAAIDGGSFFALIGEGASLLKTLSEDSPGFFSDLNRLREILAMIGSAGPATTPTRVIFSLSDRAGSMASLGAYLTNGITALPEAIASFEAETVAELARLVGGTGQIAEAFGEHSAALLKKGIPPPPTEAAKIAAYEAIAARGVKVDIDRSQVLAKAEKAKEVLRATAADHPEFAELSQVILALNAEYRVRLDTINAKIRAAHAAYRAGEASDRSEEERLTDEYHAVFSEYKARFAELSRSATSAQEQFERQKIETAEELFRAEGEAVIAAILADSPVTAEEADLWAAKQGIEEGALRKLKKLGYAPDQVRRDMAEFYRLTGGKSSAICLASDGGRRANAVGVETTTGDKVINLGSHFNKTVLFHELAHHLENDPIAKAASNGFLLKRRESPTRYTLRSLTGQQGYRSNEVAYRDSWMNPYIGKVYSDGITEVFSMGVQYLASPKDAALFVAQDPEMFALISGYLTSPLTPAMRAKLHMHEGAVEETLQKRNNEEEQYQKAIAQLAGMVSLTKDDWWGGGADVRTADYLQRNAFTNGKPPAYLGSFKDYRVFDGVFKNRDTGRKAKGYLVVRLDDKGYYPDCQAVHGGRDAMGALIAIGDYRRHALGLSDFLYKVWITYFAERGWNTAQRKGAVIQLAQEILGAKQ